jgi:ADP-heptose:LPS heptosyltransferase
MPSDEVLIITGSMIGDVILSTGVVAALLERHRGARVTLVCSPGTAILFRHAPGEIEVIPLAKRKRGGHWFELRRRLRGRRWAAVYDFRDSLFSRFVAGPRHAPTRQADQARHKVIEASTLLGDAAPRDPVLWLAAEDEARLPEALRDGRPSLVLGPGATRLGKTWPAERFGEMAARLTAPDGPLAGAVVVVTGGPMDREAAAIIGRALTPDRWVDMTGADLLVTGAAMRRAGLFVGNDSGMMHLAAASGAPPLGLFGPTDERLYGPWGRRTAVARPAGVAFTFGKISKTVSKDECQMEALTVDAVVEAARALLERA